MGSAVYSTQIVLSPLFYLKTVSLGYLLRTGKESSDRGLGGRAWVVQSVKHLTLHLSSGLNLSVVSSGPVSGSTFGMEPTLKRQSETGGRVHVCISSFVCSIHTLII